MRLVLLGPPGAGKGTQAAVLSERLGMPHISTGQMLRDALKVASPVGLEAKAYMEKGELVPDELMTRVVADRLSKADRSEGFILDGFPRTTQQAESLDVICADLNMPIDCVVYMETTPEVVIQRLSGRLVCQKCGANYHRDNLPPKVTDVCDVCTSALVQRKDDQPETVRNRLEVYEQQTAPLIDYYRTKGTLRPVSGDLNVDELYQELYDLFKKEGLVDSDTP